MDMGSFWLYKRLPDDNRLEFCIQTPKGPDDLIELLSSAKRECNGLVDLDTAQLDHGPWARALQLASVYYGQKHPDRCRTTRHVTIFLRHEDHSFERLLLLKILASPTLHPGNLTKLSR